MKVRRGLGTTDEGDADRLVAQMNELLSDETWWSAGKVQEAGRRFAKPVVDAFYDELQAIAVDSWAIRAQHIAIPGPDSGYSRVLLVGTTGAGKTSLVRQIIGSDPETDRFPSTSTAKTTIADTEVILGEGPYKAVVTFQSRIAITANVEDCILSACEAIWDGEADDQIMDRFLNHSDQRFRMGYVLGNWKPETPIGGEQTEDDWSFDLPGSEARAPQLDDDQVGDEVAQNQRALNGYLERLRGLYETGLSILSHVLGESADRFTGDDRDAALEMLQDQVETTPDFDALVHDVLDAMLERFELVEAGELQRGGDGWPRVWLFEEGDRTEFMRQVRWFSSNHHAAFGRLLTPIVDGIRVSGPFMPLFSQKQPKLALLDGQGLGHTPDSASSVSTHVTRRFADVDAILLVDSAQQPMQAAPLSVLRTVAAGGYHEKLIIAFTHFDMVKGPNLPTAEAKKTHVLASLRNSIASLRDALGPTVANALQHSVEPRCIMLGGLQFPTARLPAAIVRELERLLAELALRAAPPREPSAARPIYETDGLILGVQNAARKFQEPWMARLGLRPAPSVSKEHWTKVKALTRRLAGEFDVEYDSLRPLADLHASLVEEMSRFLDAPASWTSRPNNDDEIGRATAEVKREVYSALHDLVHARIAQEPLELWRGAYAYKGQGSANKRAMGIQGIYVDAAPIPATLINDEARRFFGEVRRIVQEAIIAAGGEIRAIAA